MGNLTIERKKEVIAALRGYVTGNDALPILSDSPCEPPDNFHRRLPGGKTGNFLHSEKNGTHWLGDKTKGVLGPLIPYYWNNYNRDQDEISDVPVWGILQDGRWISGYLVFRGDRRDDEWECHHTALVITNSIPRYDFELFAQSVQWTIRRHQENKYFHDDDVEKILCLLSEIAPIP